MSGQPFPMSTQTSVPGSVMSCQGAVSSYGPPVYTQSAPTMHHQQSFSGPTTAPAQVQVCYVELLWSTGGVQDLQVEGLIPSGVRFSHYLHIP